MLIEQNRIARAGNMRLKWQVSRQSKLEQRCAGRVGNNDPEVLALPERGAALLYDFGGALQGAVCRRVPIGKFDTLSIGDESAVVQMKMVSGDFNSLGWELCCLSVAEPGGHRRLLQGGPQMRLIQGRR
jgi:hypothetical protein